MDASNRITRIASCLQTILELEPHLKRLEIGQALMDEFDVLKEFLEKIDTVDLDEEDVRRVEEATASFLEELRAPLGAAVAQSRSRVLH